jgi:hypothetical protein
MGISVRSITSAFLVLLAGGQGAGAQARVLSGGRFMLRLQHMTGDVAYSGRVSEAG